MRIVHVRYVNVYKGESAYKIGQKIVQNASKLNTINPINIT